MSWERVGMPSKYLKTYTAQAISPGQCPTANSGNNVSNFVNTKGTGKKFRKFEDRRLYPV